VEFEIDVVEKNAGHSVYSAKTMRRLEDGDDRGGADAEHHSDQPAAT
jgi:hypothetical protein